MGANHIGEIEFLCQIAQPDYGVITNIGKAHLEGFGSYENIIKAKSELYNYIANKHGMIFVNADDQLLLNLSKQLGIKKFTYGIKENAHINSNNIASTPYLNFDYSSPDKNPVSIQTNMIGDYNLPNFLCAIAAGVFFNIPSNKVKEGCEEYIPHNNRSQFFKTNKNELILDCYNANPSSMKVALESFKKANSDNKTVILGDMFELGNNNLAAHTEIARIATNSNFNQTFFIGENFKKALDRMDIDIGAFSSTNEFINWLKINKIENNLILIKGSRLMKLEETSKYL
jgi:UDP-N-acetylmuramoyl-tripeptide--D-alanyl-D-alanine ligase